jgi:rhodanese-related sulfurtransferase
LQIGDVAVQVTVTSRHRKAAFEACEYVIDELKRRVPIWKREHYVDGTVEWVNAAEGSLREGPAVLVDSAESLQEWVLIDVRDADEVAEDPIRPFEHLVSPIVHFDRRLLSRGRPLLVCATGIRALIFADDLRREGYADVWSLTGGCSTLKQIARRHLGGG